MPNYKVIINEECHKVDFYKYSFSYAKNISIGVKEKGASASFNMKKTYSYDDFFICPKFLNILLRDMLKKIELLHIILYSRPMSISKIELYVDNIYAGECPSNSPFMKLTSLVDNQSIVIPSNWEKREFIEYMLSFTKSKGDGNGRYSAIYSYLVASSRKYEIDRFTNLWTSMNAYYTYMAEKSRSYIISNYNNIEGIENIVKSISQKDSNSMAFLSKIISKDFNLAKFDTKANKEHFRKCGIEITALSDDEVCKLYDVSESCVADKKKKDILLEKYPTLQNIASNNNILLFIMLVFQFPYLCRCEFIHGRKPTVLLAFEDEYEIQYLHKVNIILEKFLSKTLSTEYQFDDLEFIKNCYIETIDQKDYKKKMKEKLSNKEISKGANLCLKP